VKHARLANINTQPLAGLWADGKSAIVAVPDVPNMFPGLRVALQASGEYMLSTTVQASPDCCLSNLMFKADKHGSILSTAAFMEVLEDNGDMQVGTGWVRV
jgi:hypothetical protein